MNTIEKISHWVIALGSKLTAVDLWEKGSRIRTKHGMGTIIGGNIIVKLDTPAPGKHRTDFSWTFNLDNTNVRKVRILNSDIV